MISQVRPRHAPVVVQCRRIHAVLLRQVKIADSVNGFPAVPFGDSAVVQRVGESRHQGDGRVVVLDGRVVFPAVTVEVAPGVAVVRLTRSEFNRPVVVVQSGLPVTGISIRDTQVVLGVGVFRVDPRARLEIRYGFLVSSQRDPGHPSCVVVVGIVRLQINRRRVVADGVFVEPQVPPHHAAGVIRHRIFWIRDYRPRVVRNRLVQVAAITVCQAPVVVGRRELVVDLQSVVKVVDRGL